MTLQDLQKKIHDISCQHGWWDNTNPEQAVPERIALMHSELSEALEEFRQPDADLRTNRISPSGKPEGFPSELADTIIRILDLAEALDIDMWPYLLQKVEYNATRPFRHGGKRI